MALARFKADPSIVRVSIRRIGARWLATVRGANHMVQHRSGAPERAIESALREAKRAGMVGIDLFLEWAYEHPWGVGT